MDEVERRLQVDRQHGIPLRLAHAHHQAVLGNAGIVHQNIDPAEIGDDLLHDFVRLFEIGGIRGVALAFHTQCGDLRLGGFSVLVDHQIGECNIRALLGELQCNCLSDAAGGTCHDCDFSFQ